MNLDYRGYEQRLKALNDREKQLESMVELKN
jgi:hypothetical protein